jgi:acetyl esterase
VPDTTYAQVTSDNPVAEKHIYKTRGLHRLKLYIYQPSRIESDEKLPAIIFFHGGGLKERHTWEFEPQGKYLVENAL